MRISRLTHEITKTTLNNFCTLISWIYTTTAVFHRYAEHDWKYLIVHFIFINPFMAISRLPSLQKICKPIFFVFYVIATYCSCTKWTLIGIVLIVDFFKHQELLLAVLCTHILTYLETFWWWSERQSVINACTDKCTNSVVIHHI